jgi:hypothetical protein
VSVLLSSPDSFHCSEVEVFQVGLGGKEVGAGQGGGGGRTVVKILSGCLSAIEHIRRLEDLNMLLLRRSALSGERRDTAPARDAAAPPLAVLRGCKALRRELHSSREALDMRNRRL